MRAKLVKESVDNQPDYSSVQDIIGPDYTSEEISDIIKNDERVSNWEDGVISIGPLYTDRSQRKTVPGEYNNHTVYGGDPNPTYSEFQPVVNLLHWVDDVEKHHNGATWTIGETGYGYLKMTWDHKDELSSKEKTDRDISKYYNDRNGRYTGD